MTAGTAREQGPEEPAVKFFQLNIFVISRLIPGISLDEALPKVYAKLPNKPSHQGGSGTVHAGDDH